MDQNDEIIRLYSRLKSLKENLEKDKAIIVDEKYILDYHKIIEVLSQVINYNLDDFRIPDNELKPAQMGGSYNNETGEIDIQYSQERYCENPFFFIRLDAVL